MSAANELLASGWSQYTENRTKSIMVKETRNHPEAQVVYEGFNIHTSFFIAWSQFEFSALLLEAELLQGSQEEDSLVNWDVSSLRPWAF